MTKVAEKFNKRRTTHSMSRTPEYRCWIKMRQRCRDKTGENFKYYLSRGIKVCDSWQKFENFFKDMGKKPSQQHSIDRINNDFGYEPSNCRWATPFQQSNNTRRNRSIEINGERMNLQGWADRTGLCYVTILNRIKKGWNINKWLIPSQKNTCRRGHKFSKKNTLFARRENKKERVCRTCVHARNNFYYQRKKARNMDTRKCSAR